MTIINEGIFDIENNDCYKYVQKFRSKKRFLTSFRQNFNDIIAYHGTRISEQELLSIKTYGLIKANVNTLKEMATARFILHLDEPAIQLAIKLIIEDFFVTELLITIDEVNLVIDRELFEQNYHYLLFGAESLLPLADRIKRELKINARNRMVEYGTPVIVKACVPAAITKDLWINCIYEYINEGFIDISLVIKESLSANRILDITYMPTPYDIKGFIYI